MYSVKAISTLTGLTAETLRAWERRYQTVTPSRDDSGRRVYSAQDLERLLLLADLTQNGHSIGKLSVLDNRALSALTRTENKHDETGSEHFLREMTESLLLYRLDRCEQLLRRALLANEPLDYVRNILSPALNHVGQLWHDGKISIAQEHLFSACVKRIVLSMIHNIHTLTENRPVMLFATPEGEIHEFGILMTCLLAASLQYNCYFLGSDLPAEEIIEASRFITPDVLVMSLVNTPPTKIIKKSLEKISSANDLAKSQIWVGGAGAEYLRTTQELAKRFSLIIDMNDFYRQAGHIRVFQSRTP